MLIGRNSKLTMLLQDSLGGDAKALMFCNVAPVVAHAGDTFSSLAFASKVRIWMQLLRISVVSILWQGRGDYNGFIKSQK